MGPYFVRTGWDTPGTFNGAEMHLDTLAEGVMVFPTTRGPEQYHQLNRDWVKYSAYVAGGTREAAITHFRSHLSPMRSGDGLSPFGTFEFTTTALKPSFTDPNILMLAEGVMVMFEVDPVRTGTDMTWIESCNW
jgi:hypothetical protein